MSMKCPHCKGNQFKAIIRHAGIVQTNEDGEAVILREVPKFKFDIVECMQCKAKLTNEELVDDAVCAKCGKPTKTEDLVGGLCPVCHALKERPELASASQEDLIHMLIEAEKKGSSSTGTKIEKKLESADEAIQDIVKKKSKVEEKTEATSEKPTRKRKTKEDKAEAKAKETTTAKTVTKEAVMNEPEPETVPEKEEAPVEVLEPLPDEGSDLETTEASNPLDSMPMDDSFEFPQFGTDPF